MLRRCYVDMDCDFESIARPCAVLEDLSINLSCDWSHTAMGILCDTIRSCKRLVKLRGPLLDFAAWKYISSLPTLVTLEINGAGVDEPLDWDGLDVAHFLNLAALSLDFENPFSYRGQKHCHSHPTLGIPFAERIPVRCHFFPLAAGRAVSSCIIAVQSI
jgi:hypothetical protein